MDSFYSQSEFQLWRKVLSEAMNPFSLHFIYIYIYFPLFQASEHPGDNPVTVSLQTEARGAHLKQRDDWPTAIAGQHLHKVGAGAGVVEVGGSRERGIKNLAYFHRNRGTQQTCPQQSRGQVFVSETSITLLVCAQTQMIYGTKE